jgi:hypothetical protein
MKKIRITYWVITILTAIGFLISAITELTHASKTLTETTEVLGYPVYFLAMLGTAKLIGIIVILLPKYSRLKEWAYAGFAIDCIAAFWSLNAVGNAMGSIKSVAVFFFLMLSYYLMRRMQQDTPLEVGRVSNSLSS